MIKTVSSIVLFIFISHQITAQNTNSSTTSPSRPRPTNVNSSTPVPAKSAPARSIPPPKPADTAGQNQTTQTPKTTQTPVVGSQAVLAAFNRLIEGIQTANLDKVMSVYWKSPALVLFNYNGTVTKGWDQVRQNRLSSYPEIKDVKLDVRDISVTMLGRDGAVVNCSWTQSQTYKGTPETASGRMTLVFKRIENSWKAIHLHTSPDNPNPTSIPPSEQPVSPKPSPSPTP
jgi:ketosteroid isomerase-like protein